MLYGMSMNVITTYEIKSFESEIKKMTRDSFSENLNFNQSQKSENRIEDEGEGKRKK